MAADLDSIPRALTIAGSDSGAGAGIQADLKTFAAFGVYGTSAITAVTAQNTLGVDDWVAVPPELVAKQIDAVLSDIGAISVKTGMLPNAAIVDAVADRLAAHGIENLIVDPVLAATDGQSLADSDALGAIIRRLLPMARIVTPNLPEAQAITGLDIRSWDDAKRAAAQIVEMGAQSVVITGGHFESDANATDLFFDGRSFRDYTAVRIKRSNTHGTGCTFASAIAAGLARGMTLTDAIALAKSYVTLAIQHAYPIGHGHGPLHHFYRYWQPTGPKYRAGVAIK